MTGDPPTPRSIRLIVIDASEQGYASLLDLLRRPGWQVQACRVDSEAALREELRRAHTTAVIAKHRLAGFSTLQALGIVRAHDADLPFLIGSGASDGEAAVDAMRMGASDYVMKTNPGGLLPALERAMAQAGTRQRQRDDHVALQDSEARFRALTSNLPGMVFQVQHDADALRLLYVSDGSRRMFKVDPERLLGEPALLFSLLEPGGANSLRTRLLAGNRKHAHFRWVGRRASIGGEQGAWLEVAARAHVQPHGGVLWECIATDISAQKTAEERLRRSQHEIRDFVNYLARVREEERASVARELHDDVGSTLTGVRFILAALKSAPDPLAVQEKWAHLEHLIDTVIQANGRIIHDLRPGILDEGIVAALEWQAGKFETTTGVECTFVSSHQALALDPDQSIAIFRISQESLNNIAKHSGATRVGMVLSVEAGGVVLSIRDNGRGLAEADTTKPGCFGLRGMKERAFALGGWLSFGNNLDGGAIVKLSLPLHPATGASTPRNVETPCQA